MSTYDEAVQYVQKRGKLQREGVYGVRRPSSYSNLILAPDTHALAARVTERMRKAALPEPRCPFKTGDMRRLFDEAVRCYRMERKTLFNGDGTRSYVGHEASMFWRGFDGVRVGAWDVPASQSRAYAFWKAGVALGKVDLNEGSHGPGWAAP